MTMRLKQHRRAAGFTLVEILISLGVFAIGMIAVASLFPVAALLQKQTADEVIGEHAAQSAKAIIEGKGLTYDPPGGGRPAAGDLALYYSSSLSGNSKTHAAPLLALDQRFQDRFSVFDRSYPSTWYASTGAPPDLTDRDLFWVPFVQDINGNKNNPNWVMRVFLMKSESSAEYPKAGSGWANPGDPIGFPGVVSIGCAVQDSTTLRLANANHGLEGGDKIMDNNGTDYTIVEVDGAEVQVLSRILLSPAAPDTVWYAPRGTGTSSPTLRIITVKLDTTDPTP